jgi:hypothetical protein
MGQPKVAWAATPHTKLDTLWFTGPKNMKPSKQAAQSEAVFLLPFRLSCSVSTYILLYSSPLHLPRHRSAWRQRVVPRSACGGAQWVTLDTQDDLRMGMRRLCILHLQTWPLDMCINCFVMPSVRFLIFPGGLWLIEVKCAIQKTDLDYPRPQLEGYAFQLSMFRCLASPVVMIFLALKSKSVVRLKMNFH